jgi:inorganic triphosphatase YgiF
MYDSEMPPPYREVELKFGVAPEKIGELAAHPRLRALAEGLPVTRQLDSIYFDTDDLALQQRGFALRLRGEGAEWVQTLKRHVTSDPILRTREEYEAPVADRVPDLEAIADPTLRARLVKWIDGRPLVRIFETPVRRTTRRLQLGATSCRLEVDIGEIRARDATAPICELELELEHGDPISLFELAAELNASIGLRVVSESKADRGYLLYAGQRSPARKAEPIALDARMTLADAMARIASGCTGQIIDNLAPALDGVDPEGVHQFRVGIRRLRAALAVFRPVMPKQERKNLRRDLRWLAGEVGRVRDIDVFVEEQIAPAARYVGDPKPLDRLRAQAESLRCGLRAELATTLASNEFAQIAIALGAWLQRISTDGADREARAKRLSEPVSKFAAAALARRYARARTLGARALDGTQADRHALRIELKKLRYASEFFASLYPEKRSRRFIRELERLQDVLGCLNDVATARRLARALVEQSGDTPPLELERGASIIEGWIAQRAARSDASFAKCWKRFRKARAFWNH